MKFFLVFSIGYPTLPRINSNTVCYRKKGIKKKVHNHHTTPAQALFRGSQPFRAGRAQPLHKLLHETFIKFRAVTCHFLHNPSGPGLHKVVKCKINSNSIFLPPNAVQPSPLSERMPITALSPCVNEDMESRTLDANNCVVALYDVSI